MNEIAAAVVHHGTQAVIQYGSMSGMPNDNEIPEIFLGGCIARGIVDDLKLNATVERYYTKIVEEIGRGRDPDLTDVFGGLRADVALYRNGRPIAIIEIKKFEHASQKRSIVADLNKMRRAIIDTDLQLYLAVLISQTETRDVAAQVKLLSTELKQNFDVLGDEKQAGGGKADWKWQFACGSFLEA